MAKKIEKKEHNGVFRKNPATGHNHTYYSINDAPQTPDEYVKRCKEIGFTSVALNDHGTLLGVYPFMDACKEAGINGVPGIETYSKVCPEVLEDLKDYQEFMSGRTHLIINPMNYKGYQTLCYAQREATTNTEKLMKLVYPVMSCEMLEKYFRGSDDIFATSACVQGAIGYILLTNTRLKKKVEKEEKICTENQESYDAFVKKDEEYKQVDADLKSEKKEVTVLKKFLTPAFEVRIEKAKDKLKKLKEKIQPDLFDLYSENPGKDTKKYLDAKNAYESLLNSNTEAREQIGQHEAAVEELSAKKESLKLEVTELKKGATKYLKAKEKIDEQQYIPEERLYELAKKQVMYYKSVFKRFFIEVQYHNTDNEEYVMPILVRLSEETNTPLIAANDAHVSRQSEKDFESRRIIRYNYFERAQVTDDADLEMYIKDDWELFDTLSTVIPEDKAREAIMNTGILNQCHVIFPDEKHYPSVQSNESFYELLEKARQKMIDNDSWDDDHEKRYQHEIKIIPEMGYVDYHMVVMDFCNMGRKMGRIPRERLDEMPDDFNKLDEWLDENGFNIGVGVGPGRGSAAGSLVCYLLGITNIDPIKYNLLFERFLNPERVSMPDIDSDIKTSIRPYLIKYLRWKYGENAVCSIATETTYAARASVQMAGRERASQLYSYLPDKESKPLRQNYMYSTTLKISDMVPMTPGITLAQCDEEFNKNFGNNEEAKIVWEHAKLIEGKLSGTGVHAGGVIISDNDNINDYVALAWNEEKQVWAAQCDMIKAEEIGLLKMDLLGLLMLDCISDCIQMVKKHYGIEIDIDSIPFEPEVFENIYATGNTNSVFQFESPGMKSMLKDFKPTCFEDIIVLVACYRPGPMQYLDDIIKVKNGEKQVTYKTPELESILCTTYGATVYQEQVMQIFQKLAGYSLGAADMVRRAMSKKKEKKLAIERESFVNGDPERNIDGCVKRGVSAEIANEIFDEMMDFAKYAFNKSHAAAYALVSYQTAWLKYHYPAEYLCGMFNNKALDSYGPLYEDCALYGIKILPPDINKSHYDFVVENNNIRYGFAGINGLGSKNRDFLDEIYIKRKDGAYTSFQDFINRNLVIKEKANGDDKVTPPNKDMMGTLINAGCFDTFGYNRAELINSMTFFSALSEPVTNPDSENSIRNAVNSVTIPMTPVDHGYNMEKEMELLKTIVSENQLDKYLDDEAYDCTPINSLKPKKSVSIFGMVVSAELKKSSRGNNMILMKIQGKTGSCTVMAMNMLYDEYAEHLEKLERHVVKIIGSVNDGGTMFANIIADLSAWKSNAFCMSLKTEEEIRFVKDLKKEERERDIEVAVQFYYVVSKATHTYKRVDVPRIGKSFFSKEELDMISAKGIQIMEWENL